MSELTLKQIINSLDYFNEKKLIELKTLLNQKLELCMKEAEWKQILFEYNQPSEEERFKIFIDEMIEFTENDCQTRLDELYYEFQLWHKKIYGEGIRCPSRKDLKLTMTKKYSDRSPSNNKNAWLGLKMRDFDEVQALKLLNEESTS